MDSHLATNHSERKAHLEVLCATSTLLVIMKALFQEMLMQQLQQAEMDQRQDLLQ